MPDARQLKEALLHAFNDHDVTRILECFSPDAVLVSPAGIAEGHEEIAWYFEHLFKAFPDLRLTVQHRITCADPAVTEWTITGTHSGPFLLAGGNEVEATGRHVTFHGCNGSDVADGKIITHREYFNQLELYGQLGFGLVSAV